MNTTTVGAIILTGLCLLILTVSGAYADGQDIFISRCGVCHRSGGEAPVFAPTKYASRQWERFFERNTHKRKKDISREFTPNELELAKKYLMNHAADSDQPVAIGLR
jgi:mono/diheme cytochrome c family protein